MHRDRPDARLARRSPSGSATARTSPARSTSPAASSAISKRCARSTPALPDDWRIFIEHKMYEPAFYSTVVQDWGTNYLIATRAGRQGLLPRRPRPPRAERQHRDDRGPADPVRQARRLPLQRFASTATTISTPARSIPTGCSWSSTNWSTPSCAGAEGFDPAHMLDQCHNVTDPIESLMRQRHRSLQRAYAQALLVDRAALAGYPGRQRRADGDADAEGRLPHRCRADPRHGAAATAAARSTRSPPIARRATARRSPRSGRPSPAVAAASSEELIVQARPTAGEEPDYAADRHLPNPLPSSPRT